MTDTATTILQQSSSLMNNSSNKRTREAPTIDPEQESTRTSTQPVADSESLRRTSPSVRQTAPIQTPPASIARNSRRSLAAYAREKTSSAFANLASITTNSNPTLRSASSSGSLGRQSRIVSNGGAAEPSIPNLRFSDSSSNSQGPSEYPTALPDVPRASIQTTHLDIDPTPSPEYQSAPSTPRRYPLHSTTNSLDRTPSPPPEYLPQGSYNKMHQTSSRLLRMTDEERPYTRVSKFRITMWYSCFFLSRDGRPAICARLATCLEQPNVSLRVHGSDSIQEQSGGGFVKDPWQHDRTP